MNLITYLHNLTIPSNFQPISMIIFLNLISMRIFSMVPTTYLYDSVPKVIFCSVETFSRLLLLNESRHDHRRQTTKRASQWSKSVTRFCDFPKYLAKNFLTKVAQMFGEPFWLFWRMKLFYKNWCGYFWDISWKIGLLFIPTSGHTRCGQDFKSVWRPTTQSVIT